uniref:Uncharacterized protein n=1 Tax=Loa loa TaxID=7209 RepID=A0A1I7W5S5_LOALO
MPEDSHQYKGQKKPRSAETRKGANRMCEGESLALEWQSNDTTLLRASADWKQMCGQNKSFT